MAVKTKRWNDPKDADDGFRLLVCRYRPRGVKKNEETWDAWSPELGPSRELHTEYFGKHGPPIGWAEYRRRYLSEMKAQARRISELAERVKKGARLTLLCSSRCVNVERCHRALLARLLEQRAGR